jgi:uncharacterized protein with GYD domain
MKQSPFPGFDPTDLKTSDGECIHCNKRTTHINSRLPIYLSYMSDYILLINWTEQGISKIKESPDRYNSFKASLEKAGGKLIGGYYTFGEYDVIIIIEAPNDEVVMSLMLKVCSYGNVRTKTLKAFNAEQGIKIIKDLP